MPAELKNDRFLRALRRQPTDTTPVWIMRQAGRYLPEYRATREKAGSFMALAQNPELACEVTLQPLERFELDAAILFSDILTIPDAMGLGLTFAAGEGPKFERPLRSAADIQRLAVPDMDGELRYVMDAVRLIRRELDGRVPLIGFSGSPWTLACYMVEGQGSRDFARVKAMAWNDPGTMHALLDVLARSVARYLSAQAEAGAQALMVFDTWGGLLAPGMFHDFSLRYLAQVTDLLKADTHARELPLVLFSKGANSHLEALAGTGCDGLGLDWTISLAEARHRVGERVALQGNLDPSALFASPDIIQREVDAAITAFGPHPGHVFNLGHGVTPGVDPEHVKVLIDAVHAAGRRIREPA
ncbi:uroporphyrinogen decarboxylase [Oleiagrimonas sp.]|jgi:uroporphyrinogen decarboxylase|uniref:uroporphyrinogen decarboxylase n=1 Tax=Oleiagrimonas sp. TaxID=2010330 RepID=UPI002603994C|nr:uroporphyrinogen decarboxylase [Oleiagrimonas sp.]MDA3912823.1 uroporphyrinogen decarboxylase [Oleiagrimonas sp.]